MVCGSTARRVVTPPGSATRQTRAVEEPLESSPPITNNARSAASTTSRARGAGNCHGAVVICSVADADATVERAVALSAGPAAVVEPVADVVAGFPVFVLALLEHAVKAATANTATTATTGLRARPEQSLSTTADPNGPRQRVAVARYGRPESGSARQAAPLAAATARNRALCSGDGVPFPTANTSFCVPGVSMNTRARQRASTPST
jgi:hypothetical protein